MKGKTIFISGGSKGIGLAAVRRFVANKDNRVITCGRTLETWKLAVTQHPELDKVDFLAIDLTQKQQVKQLFEHIASNYGQLDIAINNASPDIKAIGPFTDISLENLYGTMIDDLWSHTMCIQHQLALMSEGSTIINISSINGLGASSRCCYVQRR